MEFALGLAEKVAKILMRTKKLSHFKSFKTHIYKETTVVPVKIILICPFYEIATQYLLSNIFKLGFASSAAKCTSRMPL